jgi:magnesium transporter
MDQPKALKDVLKINEVTWVNVAKPSKDMFKVLENQFNLHPVHLKESTQTVQLIEVEREDNYIFFLAHLPIYDASVDRIYTSQVGIFLGRDFVITIHDGYKSAITELFEQCKGDPELAKLLCHDSAGYLLYTILKQLLEDVSHTLENILEELDTTETLVFDDDRSDAFQIGKLRQKITRIKRVVKPLQLVLGDLAEQINNFNGEHLNKYYANNAKLAHKLSEVIDEAQETIEIFKDADFTTSTEKTNQILAVLTLVFTFTIPITVLGTLYGMNVPLPGGTEFASWSFLGVYTTAILVALVSLFLAIGMFLYFKTKRWF